MAKCFDEFYDVVIIGGGATGCGIALDSSLRGYKTLLIEKNDFASGSSSKSTKLIHGGVRYLEKAITNVDVSQYHLVKEALEERAFFLNNAPHLSKPITLLTPIYKWFEIPYIYTGLYLYDFISGNKSLGHSSFVFKDKILSSHPFVKHKDLCGGVKYYDGCFNDSRMAIALLQTSQENGAVVRNYHEVKSFIYEDEKLIGLNIKDETKQKNYKVNASCIINATGIYVDDIRALDDKESTKILSFSSGVHIVVDKKYLTVQEGILIPKTKDGRVIFILPWQDFCLIGTTENSESSNQNIQVTKEEITYLLNEINRYFDTLINLSDVLSSWKGIRPLVNSNSKTKTSNIVREHYICKSKSNLITIAGGKWTIYRKMAEDVLDFAINNELLTFKKVCETKNHKVVGSQKSITIEAKNISSDQYSMLNNLYGDQMSKVLEIAKEENAYEKISENCLYIKAQIMYSVRFEYVKRPLDFLSRRTPILLLNIKVAMSCLEYVTKVISEMLLWDKTKYLEELENAKVKIKESRF